MVSFGLCAAIAVLTIGADAAATAAVPVPAVFRKFLRLIDSTEFSPPSLRILTTPASNDQSDFDQESILRHLGPGSAVLELLANLVEIELDREI